jgi:hypothetical protein
LLQAGYLDSCHFPAAPSRCGGLRADRATTSLDCEVSKGVVPIRDILKALRTVRYSGCLSLEYEAEPENPFGGMRGSLAYIRGVLGGLEA